MTPAEALEKAEAVNLDLVEVSPNAKPPVCRIIDHGKFKYEQEKLAKESKKKQRVIVVKEIRMRLRIEDHDYQVKLRNIQKFLGHGDRVKVAVFFRGREMAQRELGRQILDRVMKDAELWGEVEKLPSFEGRNMVMYLIAIKKGKKDAKDKNKSGSSEKVQADKVGENQKSEGL